jgi:flavin reductase (DIM6/NTAB) family NADH-FMN oxidoreductase RutF
MHKTSVQEAEQRRFRRALGRFASGVVVITTTHGGTVHGMTANAFCSVSLDPLLVLVAVHNHSTMHRLLAQSGRYGVSVLARSQEALARHFAGRSQEGLQVPFVWHEGCPLIAGALAQLTCSVVNAPAAGDHTLYLGLVESLSSSDEGAPLLFYMGEYRALEGPL